MFLIHKHHSLCPLFARACLQVLCQLIDLNPLPGGTSACNLGTDPAGEGIPASGVDARSWDAFQWSPDYQGFDLAPLEHTPDADGYFTCQAGRWKPMSEPAEAMHFDFTKGWAS